MMRSFTYSKRIQHYKRHVRNTSDFNKTIWPRERVLTFRLGTEFIPTLKTIRSLSMHVRYIYVYVGPLSVLSGYSYIVYCVYCMLYKRKKSKNAGLWVSKEGSNCIGTMILWLCLFAFVSSCQGVLEDLIISRGSLFPSFSPQVYHYILQLDTTSNDLLEAKVETVSIKAQYNERRYRCLIDHMNTRSSAFSLAIPVSSVYPSLVNVMLIDQVRNKINICNESE